MSTSAMLSPFRSDEFELSITPHEIDGFRVLAPGLARALAVSDAYTLLRAVPDEEKGSALVRTLGGEQRVGYVTEAGFYRALGQRQTGRISDDAIRAQVERFQAWVYREVLPSLRKTGSYEVERLTPLQLAERLVDAERRAEAHQQRVLELEGPASQAETFRAAEGLCTIGDLANRFRMWAYENKPSVKVTQKQVFDHAAMIGLIIRGNTVRHNQPTSQGIKAGWVKPHRAEYDTRTRGMQTTVSTRLTSRGEARLWDHLVEYLRAHGSLDKEAA